MHWLARALQAPCGEAEKTRRFTSSESHLGCSRCATLICSATLMCCRPATVRHWRRPLGHLRRMSTSRMLVGNPTTRSPDEPCAFVTRTATSGGCPACRHRLALRSHRGLMRATVRRIHSASCAGLSRASTSLRLPRRGSPGQARHDGGLGRRTCSFMARRH
jgi:hypothetical protein